MVPVEVGYEDVRGEGLVAEFLFQMVAQDSESGAAIEDVDAVSEPHLDAGGVAAIAHVLGLWGGRRAAHSPDLDPHSPECCLICNLRLEEGSRQLDWWVRGYYRSVQQWSVASGGNCGKHTPPCDHLVTIHGVCGIDDG